MLLWRTQAFSSDARVSCFRDRTDWICPV